MSILGDATMVARDPNTPALGAVMEAATREPGGQPPDAEEPTERDAEGADERPLASPFRCTVAAGLGSAAAGWMLAGPFAGAAPKAAALAGVALAAGMVAASYRFSRPAVLQLLVLPGAVLLSLAAVLPTGAALGRTPDFVVESLRSGGLANPPVPFDPGWRVLIVLISAYLTVAAATAAVEFNRPRLAVAISGAVAVVALLFQPTGHELANIVVALVLVVAGLAVGHGAELARDGVSGGAFEARRLLQAGAIAGLLIAAMVLIDRMGLLLPDATQDEVVPPARPQVEAAARDRVLFTVVSERDDVPWRVGVLDVYRDGAWMTPPFDPRRLVDLGSGRPIPSGVPSDRKPLGAVVTSQPKFTATFTIKDVPGRAVPLPAGVTALAGDLGDPQYDPRTQTLRVAGRQSPGTTYTVTAAVPPTVGQLVSAGEGPASTSDLDEFREAPDVGPVANALIARTLAADASPFERLQLVRAALFREVVAAGRGDPLDVPAPRVDAMLEGGEASPYEIVAAEALLARWSGLPARIGYGYHGGDTVDDAREIRPRHGAMWLEVYFDGVGWVPLLGRPSQAKASLNAQRENEDPLLRPADEIAARVFVPTASTSLQPVYVLVRYWLSRVLPLALAALGIVGGYPAVFKGLRRWRRRRWADRTGPKARIAVAYVDVRDVANDLNIGHPTLTPIEFLDAVEPDAEHRELAWLVTRTMWGDLQRAVDESDAVAAEELGRSLRKRLSGGQPYTIRVLAAVGRVSLRQPFDADVPSLWWTKRHYEAAPRISVAGRTRAVAYRIRRLRRRLPRGLSMLIPTRLPKLRLRLVGPLAVLGMVATAIAATGGAQQVDLSSPASFKLPEVPADIAGFRFERFEGAQAAFDAPGRASLLAGGTLYGIRHDGVIVGTLQQSSIKPGPRRRAGELRSGLLTSLQLGPETLVRLGGERVYVRRVPEQTQYLWLAADLSSFQLVVATRELAEGDALFSALLSAQRGEPVGQLEPPSDTPPLDPRRAIP